MNHNNLILQETLIDKYIGFDADSKKTVARVIQKGDRDNRTSTNEKIYEF